MAIFEVLIWTMVISVILSFFMVIFEVFPIKYRPSVFIMLKSPVSLNATLFIESNQYPSRTHGE